ncbi:hypothetical protein QVZ41_13055 [Wenyingzhuangia sp. chi5]|uniref:Uncharacterized protein n=1 Tax=Wenyingzhuangia gilva TaxID=3057677 RepID=A0ABT8VUX4_9FLAO|nr:hypothetical protein [Wenyingzhuangia sp. chi5]MDO3695771.1 hypothetical protein [Wenyingzhuangia sp. chi5]
MFQKFILILLLTTLSLRPAYFVGNVVYYETHLSEIIEKYCVNKDKPELQCNGQCHLAKELSVADASKDGKAIVEVSAAFFPVYFQEIEQTNLSFFSIMKKTPYLDYDFTYAYMLSHRINKPPMVSF